VKWLRTDALLVAHDGQLREHGGRRGLRDRALLESALARPRNKHEYEGADVVACAAALAYGLAKNHPFVDGNKRMALLGMFMFLEINGVTFDCDDAETATVFVMLAGGRLSEAEFEAWLRRRIERG